MEIKKRINIKPVIQAILAAALFGVSAPVAKLLVGEIPPVLLASLLYLGSGLGLSLYKIIQNIYLPSSGREARLSRDDTFWLTGSILSGGVIAPIVLMFSLQNTTGATASLLLNFEGVATTIIAYFAFKESVNKRIWLAIISVTFASIILSLDLSGKFGLSIGAIGVLFACALWGIDNNFTRNISAKDPIAIARFKGFGAGFFSLLLALMLGNKFPHIPVICYALLLGCFSYGISFVLFVFALRSLGAARTSAFFGSAPFVGSALSFLILQGSSNYLFFISLPFMIAGTVLLLSEDHSHCHTHDELEHEHIHNHDDEHHIHEHIVKIDNLKKFTHSHPHKHHPINHNHIHTPDIHHRHIHEKEIITK